MVVPPVVGSCNHVRYVPPGSRVPLPPVPQDRRQEIRRRAFGQPLVGRHPQLVEQRRLLLGRWVLAPRRFRRYQPHHP